MVRPGLRPVKERKRSRGPPERFPDHVNTLPVSAHTSRRRFLAFDNPTCYQ
jgi:hypothetical protein